MEPENLLPFSETPATTPYPMPDESSPQPHTVSSRSTLILSSYLGLQNGIFYQAFPKSSKLLIAHFRAKFLSNLMRRPTSTHSFLI